MRVDDLQLYFGVKTDKALTKYLNVSTSTISKWRKSGIPERRQALIEIQTKGRLKANIERSK